MKQKIAILGGGVSSMTTAIQITEEPNWQDKFDITVYQMGWRLGGKGASGRNQEIYDRIEEHGLHLWFGFYDNAFELMKRCYKANNRLPGKPLATWQEAFKPNDLVVLEEYVWGKWEHLPIVLPRNNEIPGGNGQLPSIWEYIGHILNFVKDSHKLLSTKLKTNIPQATTEEHNKWFENIEHLWDKVKDSTEAIELDIVGRLIFTALKLVDDLGGNNPNNHNILLKIIHRVLQLLWQHLERIIDNNPDARYLWIVVDLGLANVKGIIEDGVITKGFNFINDIDYRDWIVKHGAAPITVDSALVQAIYGLVFGGYKYFSFEAGTALRGVLRLALTYRGSVYYRMQAGMGDTIFAPIYEVLKARGVKFEFFNKVTNLGLSNDETNIDTISIDVQATIKNGIEYSPLYNVKDLPCWPSYPLYEQLVQGNAIQTENINLESYWTPWQSVDKKTLRRGVDFDIVVQGISLGALPVIAKELIKKSVRWQNMVKNITPCQTQAFQLWFHPDIEQLGWPYAKSKMPDSDSNKDPQYELALSGSYKEPMDTWADMSQLIDRESWPEDNAPKNIAYVCGPVQQKVDYSKWDFNDHNAPEKAYNEVKDTTKEYLQTLSAHLWPNASDEKGNFKWDLLVDKDNAPGNKRFDSQWFRANIDPTELYVLSTTNSSKFRLKTNDTDFDNLLITGDWIDNGFNAGCVEASVMAGMQTARAILKQDFDIVGEKDIV